MIPHILINVGKQFLLSSVTRVRSTRSKGITEVLLPYNFHGLENAGSLSKKTAKYKKNSTNYLVGQGLVP